MDALRGLSGLLWERWVGVWYMCGMRNGWPQVALCGSLTCMADRGRWLLARIYCSTISCFQILRGSAEYSFGRQQLISLLLLVPL
eukprot:COSAG01_NODE_6538_length_3614_cov_1041.928612_3_plen_85_part_00